MSLDAGVMPLFFGATLAFLAALEQPSWRRTLGAALLFGLANLAKFTALALGPAFVALSAWAAVSRRSPRPLATLALTFAGGLGVFAAGYGFDAKRLDQAWASPYFVRDVPAGSVTVEELAQALADAGGADDEVARLGAAPDAARAVELLGFALESPDRAPRAAAALGALEGGPGELRRRAFEALLNTPAERVGAERRASVLAALSGRRMDDDASWRKLLETTRGHSWDRVIFYHGWMRALTGLWGDQRPVPLLTALKGLDQTLAHGAIGHSSYFRGRRLDPGRDFAEGNPHPEYYAVVMAVKNPLGALVLFLAGVGWALVPDRRRGWTPLVALALVGVPAFLFVSFSLGKALLGVRYLLPLYPFLALLGARVFAALPRTAWALFALSVVEFLGIHPHELMYYNLPAGGSAGGPRITVVGDDWGQGVRTVGRFYGRYRDEIDAAGGLVYRPYSMADPAAFGLEGLRPHAGPVEGLVAVHAVDLQREAAEFAWLAAYEPFLVLDRSVLVYDTRTPAPGGDPLEAWEAAR